MELLEANNKLNLISTYTEKNSDVIHFYDCIKASQFIQSDSKHDTYYDFGSGNGFPGIVFGILFNNVKSYLVEMDSRKADFLRQIVLKLQLTNIQVSEMRVESIRTKGSCGAMCRGFSNLARTLLMSNKILPVGSTIYHLKGPDWFTELTSLPVQICSTWNTEMACEYDLPDNLGSRVILRSVRIG